MFVTSKTIGDCLCYWFEENMCKLCYFRRAQGTWFQEYLGNRKGTNWLLSFDFRNHGQEGKSVWENFKWENLFFDYGNFSKEKRNNEKNHFWKVFWTHFKNWNKTKIINEKFRNNDSQNWIQTKKPNENRSINTPKIQWMVTKIIRRNKNSWRRKLWIETSVTVCNWQFRSRHFVRRWLNNRTNQ